MTLVPGADRIALAAWIDTTEPVASVKDSFAGLDLTQFGFRVLFEAQWIHRPASATDLASDLARTVVSTPDTLRT